ncbi:MAG: hypothetical protein VX463_17555, partial [Pseudomonadota bacterium]|nr:hypothetical protein [Pseudomonadota bacterium]
MSGGEWIMRHAPRWLETGVAAAVSGGLLAVGALMLQRGGLMGWPVLVAGLVALLWLHAAWERARVPRGLAGPGVVTVEEGRVAYFGPSDGLSEGGVVALADLWTVEAIQLRDNAGLAWRLRPVDAPPLLVPIGAEGVEALPEALSVLPGFSMRAVREAFDADGVGVRPIWRRETTHDRQR